MKLFHACTGVVKNVKLTLTIEVHWTEFYQQCGRHIQNCQITLPLGTVRKTPSPNKQPLSRPGSTGGTPGTVLR